MNWKNSNLVNISEAEYYSKGLFLFAGLLVGMGFGLLSSSVDFQDLSFNDYNVPKEDNTSQNIEELENFPYDVQFGVASENVTWDGKEVELAGRPYIGREGAEVTIIAYEDYFCPFCAGFHNDDFGAKANINTVFDKMVEEHIQTGDAKYYFKNYPLVGGERTAEISECVVEYGTSEAFWTFNYNHFQNYEKLVNLQQDSPEKYDEIILEWSSQLEIDEAEFKECINSDEKKKLISKHTQEAESLGATSTPSHFIEGELVSGSQHYFTFKTIIEEKIRNQ